MMLQLMCQRKKRPTLSKSETLTTPLLPHINVWLQF